MKKYLVEDVKVDVDNAGFACGPVPGAVVAELTLRNLESDEVEYHSLAEVEGILHFGKMGKSTFDAQIGKVDDPDVWEEIGSGIVQAYDNYFDFYSDLYQHKVPSEEMAYAWKLLAYLIYADEDEAEQMKENCIGRCLGDFEIPVCEEEEEYLEERDEEDDESEKEDFDDDSDEEAEETESDDDSEDAGREELQDALEAAFVGQKIDVNAFVDRDENESPEGDYTSKVQFSEGGHEYQLTYGLIVNEEAEITSLYWLTCEKLVDGEYRPCEEAEVGVKKIYEVLYEELEGWL